MGKVADFCRANVGKDSVEAGSHLEQVDPFAEVQLSLFPGR